MNVKQFLGRSPRIRAIKTDISIPTKGFEMGDSKHTPPPWRVYDWTSKGKDRARHMGVTMTKGDVANICLGNAGRSSEECEANARLIAVAPDLLGALESVLLTGGRDESACRIAWGVINKARGE